MAVNRVYPGKNTTLPLTLAQAMNARTNNVPQSGDAVVIGQIGGVALEAGDANGRTVVQIDGVFLLPVQAINGGGNVAISGGDELYFTIGDNPPLSKKTSGVPFGYALGDAGVQMVASGVTTASINVLIKR